MNIGLDAMGGDFAPDAAVKGAILAQKEISSETASGGKAVRFVLIGNKDAIIPILKAEKADPDDFDIVHSTEVIGMGEHPTIALKQKPKSSIAIGYHLLREGKIAGFASAGNTGAMFVGAMFSVKAVAGVIRPSLASIVPKEKGGIGIILDVGANADCRPDVLSQFAVLGSLFAENVYGIKNPKVALLNIGEEVEKGNLVSQAAHKLIKNVSDVNFIGNIEGRDLFNDKADVIVCDGFTGNVVLKLAESFYTLIRKRKIQNEYFDRFNYEIYGGTPVIGINSTAVIGHGISSPLAIKNMLLFTKNIAQSNLTEKIKMAFL